MLVDDGLDDGLVDDGLDDGLVDDSPDHFPYTLLA